MSPVIKLVRRRTGAPAHQTTLNATSAATAMTTVMGYQLETLALLKRMTCHHLRHQNPMRTNTMANQVTPAVATAAATSRAPTLKLRQILEKRKIQ